MKRLLIAVGAIAATTLAIEKVIEYAMKKDVTEEFDDIQEDVCQENEEYICLNEVEEPEEVVEEIAEEIEDIFEEKVDEFDEFVDEASNTVKEIGGKVRNFFNNLPKISITINVDKNEK